MFILGREFTLGQGFLAAIRSVLGDAPVAVIAHDEKDIAFLKDFNGKLPEAQRVMIISDSIVDIIKATRLMKKQVKTGRFNLQVLLYGAETLAAGVPDNTIRRITQRMFLNFLRAAGQSVSDRVNQMADEFRAIAKAA